MTQEQITKAVGGFLEKQLRAELGPDDPIFGSGLANSLFAMQLVLFVEREFGISVQNEDLEMSNFETIGSVTRLVARKNGAVG
jgi:methoxymalonate biosynthesis acyl carrier protein